MPALSVLVDGVGIATVCTDGYDVLSVWTAGTRIDEEPATLHVAGGSYPEGGKSTHLTWVPELSLRWGQTVTVRFLSGGVCSHPGKTLEELFPDDVSEAPDDFKPTASIFASLRARPRLRDNFAFRLAISSGTSFIGTTAEDEHGFGFSVLWNSLNPDRARVSLHSYTLDALESRTPMKYHVKEGMRCGDSVRFELVA